MQRGQILAACQVADKKGANFLFKLEAEEVFSNVYPVNKRLIWRKICSGCLFVRYDFHLRACLHGSGGPQVGEVTRQGGVTRLSI